MLEEQQSCSTVRTAKNCNLCRYPTYGKIMKFFACDEDKWCNQRWALTMKQYGSCQQKMHRTVSTEMRLSISRTLNRRLRSVPSIKQRNDALWWQREDRRIAWILGQAYATGEKFLFCACESDMLTRKRQNIDLQDFAESIISEVVILTTQYEGAARAACKLDGFAATE